MDSVSGKCGNNLGGLGIVCRLDPESNHLSRCKVFVMYACRYAQD